MIQFFHYECVNFYSHFQGYLILSLFLHWMLWDLMLVLLIIFFHFISMLFCLIMQSRLHESLWSFLKLSIHLILARLAFHWGVLSRFKDRYLIGRWCFLIDFLVIIFIFLCLCSPLWKVLLNLWVIVFDCWVMNS